MSQLSLKTKILLLALIPLVLLGLLTTTLAVYSTSSLGQQNIQSFTEKFYDLRKSELKNYTQIARSSIDSIIGDGRTDKQQQAMDVLRDMRFGDDGYFFVYDYNGVNVMHPKKPQLEGKNLWDLEDTNGVKLIQNLVANAQEGGGYTDYLWHKPSVDQVLPKIGYSLGVDSWQWMLGTGLYVDDLDEAIGKIERSVEREVRNAALLTIFLAVVVTLIITVVGSRFIAHESDLADTNLRSMAEGISSSKEEERVRVARELEQGANFHLIKAKRLIDELGEKIENSGQVLDPKIFQTRQEVRSAIDHIYGVVCDLRPPKLVESGLKPALSELVSRMSKTGGCDIKFRYKGTTRRMKTEIETALYRVTHLALTNIVKHSGADEAEVWLSQTERAVQVTIKDKGIGFNVGERLEQNGDVQSGLSEMKILMSAAGGSLRLFSTPYMGSMLRLEVPLV